MIWGLGLGVYRVIEGGWAVRRRGEAAGVDVAELLLLFRVQDFGFRVWGLGLGVHDLEFRMWNSGFRI